MAGSDDPIFEDDDHHPQSATVTVYRMTQGQRFAYTATARWSEYCPDTAPMWKRMPHTMLGKCAEALALRKAFPQQLAGLYTTDEMDQASQPATSQRVTPDPPAVLVDVTDGVEVPNIAETAKPEPPAGFAYLTDLSISNGWMQVGWQGLEYKTKLMTIIDVATHAYQNGQPVKVHKQESAVAGSGRNLEADAGRRQHAIASTRGVLMASQCHVSAADYKRQGIESPPMRELEAE